MDISLNIDGSVVIFLCAVAIVLRLAKIENWLAGLRKKKQ